MGQHQEAIRRATAILRRDPADFLTWQFKGEQLFELGRYAEVAGCFVSVRPTAFLTWML
jgi:hypothetical protein